ncbi:MAG: cobalt-zinc-cadmium efflux system membrane fusion protein [Planctomycetota bacterium]|jgi:cobalt-zinc-cadmium efflux system membrane fusion protein
MSRLGLGKHTNETAMISTRTISHAAAVLLLCASASGGSVRSTQNPRPVEKPVWIGVSAASQISMVGCQQDGVIVEVAVVEGQRVAKGDVLVRLDTRVQLARIARLRIAANADVRTREAKHRLVLATQEEMRLTKLNTQEIASSADLARAKLERIIAEIGVDAAKIETQLAHASLDEAMHTLDRLTVCSPFDGTVAKLLHHLGDAVERLQPMAQMVVIDPLWVEFDCPLAQAYLLPQGSMVMVVPVIRGAQPRRGIVTNRAVLADAASQTRKVRISVPNRDHDWIAGSKMRIWVDQAGVTPARPK